MVICTFIGKKSKKILPLYAFNIPGSAPDCRKWNLPANFADDMGIMAIQAPVSIYTNMYPG